MDVILLCELARITKNAVIIIINHGGTNHNCCFRLVILHGGVGHSSPGIPPDKTPADPLLYSRHSPWQSPDILPTQFLLPILQTFPSQFMWVVLGMLVFHVSCAAFLAQCKTTIIISFLSFVMWNDLDLLTLNYHCFTILKCTFTLLELSDLHRIISYTSRSPARLSVVKPLDMLLLQFGILSNSTLDIHLLLVPLNVT